MCQSSLEWDVSFSLRSGLLPSTQADQLTSSYLSFLTASYAFYAEEKMNELEEITVQVKTSLISSCSLDACS